MLKDHLVEFYSSLCLKVISYDVFICRWLMLVQELYFTELILTIAEDLFYRIESSHALLLFDKLILVFDGCLDLFSFWEVRQRVVMILC